MKKLLFTTIMLFALVATAFAQSDARISFDATTFNFGTFPESKLQTHVFTFKNTGTAPLIVNQAVASCGCTVATYTKKPVAPGEKGEVKVTYNGKGKMPGRFKKVITIRTNASNSLARIYITGEMEESKQ